MSFEQKLKFIKGTEELEDEDVLAGYDIKPNKTNFYANGAESPRSTHIGWYLHPDSKVNLLRYLKETGLHHKNHQAVSMHEAHATVLYHGALRVPTTYDKTQSINTSTTPGEKMLVNTAGNRGSRPTHGSPISLILPHTFNHIKIRSQKLHHRFGLTPNPSDYQHHILLSRVQIFPKGTRAHDASHFKTIEDYYKLPPVDFPIRFNEELMSHKG